MCIADFEEGDAAVDDVEWVKGAVVGATKADGAIMCGCDESDGASERCDRKLREVVMIFMLVGLIVLNVPCGVSPKYGHVHGGGRSNVDSFE